MTITARRGPFVAAFVCGLLFFSVRPVGLAAAGRIATGTLVIAVSGLPSGVSASVVVSGPDNFSLRVGGSQSIGNCPLRC